MTEATIFAWTGPTPPEGYPAFLNISRDSWRSACGILSIKADDGTFTAKLEIGRDESVEIFEPASILEDYMRKVVKVEPDKVLIRAAVKDGFAVPGARLVKKDRLTIK